MLAVSLLLLVCCAVVARSMHYPAHLSKWNGAGGHRGVSKRSNGLEMEKLSWVDLVASSAVQEESKRGNILKGLVRVKDRLTCTISRALPGMSRFLSEDASCPYIDKKTGAKKGDSCSSSEDVKVASENELKQNSGKKRVLILMSDTGGGHRASAQAIDRSLKEQFPGKIDVDIIDIWTSYAKWPFNRFVPTYRYVAQRPMMWRGFYAYGQFPPTKFFTETWSWMTSYGSFKNAIVSRDPDLVVSVHPLCQLMPIWVVEQMNKARSNNKPPIPFVTVVTDLGGAHGTWFDRRADAVFVPSDAVARIARRCRIKKAKVVQRGLPIRPAFWSKAKGQKAAIRKSLGLWEDYKTILLMGGGDGVGGLGKIATEIANKCSKNEGVKTQMVVICGNNEKLKHELRAKAHPENMKVVVRGFVNNIHEYMGASDCIVTKAGPGTIAEAMTRGLPIVLSSFLPGQEAGNVPYVVQGGFGLYPGPKPRKIASSVAKLIMDDKRMQIMSEKALATARPEATQEIARDIGNIVLRPFGKNNILDLVKK